MYKDEKKMKVIQNLRRELVILKPDKGNGIVVISIANYYKSLYHLFSDTSKFRQLKEDPTQMRLLSLQNLLLKLKNRNEISESIYKQIRPQYAKPGRAHALSKIHKDYDVLPKCRPIIDTVGSSHYHVGKYLTVLLNPLTT